jgi:hypothetical protein
MERNRVLQTVSLKDRLAAFAKEVREKASQLRPGPEQNALFEKVRQADTAAQWANSWELQPPKWIVDPAFLDI